MESTQTYTHTKSQNFFKGDFQKKPIKQDFATIFGTQLLPNLFGNLKCLILHTASGLMFATIPVLNVNVVYLQMTGA